MIRPPKKVWLEETADSEHTSRFEVYQVFDNLIRRGLAHMGGPTERRLDGLAATSAGDDVVRSVKTWNVPPSTGLRLRALYEFRNDAGLRSPRLMAHRLAKLKVSGGASAKANTMPLTGVPIGVGGKGSVEGDILFATDPAVSLRVLRPGGGPSDPLRDMVLDSYAELAESASEVGVDPAAASEAFEDLFADFLPDSHQPDEWKFEMPTGIEGDEGDSIPFSIEIDAQVPGQSLIALEAQNLGDPSEVAFSEIFAIEVTEQLDITLLRGSEVGASPVDLAYAPGLLSTHELQAEIDGIWRARFVNPDVAQAIEVAGVDLDELPAYRSPPLRVAQEAPGNEVFVVTAFDSALSLWREVLLPRIKERHGADALREEQSRD